MACRVLNVAEKNDAAKEIARIMSRGGNGRREGLSLYNKIYEYEYNLLNRRCEMIMTSVSGHLMGYDFDSRYRGWQTCAPLVLFDAPLQKSVPEHMVSIQRTLETEVQSCDTLIIWTDCDREGENIGYEIIDICQNTKPQIDIYRARFSEITASSIARACANLVRPDKATSLAVDARQELDLRIGAAFTRYQTLRLQKCFPGKLSGQLISYGSCQFPTLGFVCERFKEIQAFVSETFYKINVIHKTQEGDVEFLWKRIRVFDQLVCQVLHETCLENPQAKVTHQTSKPKSKWRPVALDTVELEKLASRKLRINAKETMRIAEKLYTQGYISYPRTETNMFQSLDLGDLITHQTVDPNWGPFAQNLLVDGPNPRNGTKTDNAHPPIHPTKYTQNLQGNEKRLYEFIVRHFLACCSKDAQGVETVVEITVAGEEFTAKGLSITARNYLEVYPYERWSDKTLPVYQVGDTFMPSAINMIQGETQPPSLLTEADLIALMEKHGIGTDATHAEHIETIKNRLYVGVQPDGTFIPGELGMGLVEGYDLMGFGMSKPHLRAGLEADLKRICLGQKRKDDVLREQIAQYKDMFVQTVAHVENLDQALSQYLGQPRELTEDPTEARIEPVFTCPICRSNEICLKKTSTDKLVLSCAGFPNCTARAFLPGFVLKAAVLERACSSCGPQLHVREVKLEFKRGSVPPMMPLEYTSCLKCDTWLRELLDFRITAAPVNQRPERGGRQGRNVPQQPRGNRGRRQRRGAARGPQARGGGPPPRGGGPPPRGGGPPPRGGGRPPRGEGQPPRGGQFGGPPPRGGQFGGPPPRGGQFGIGGPPRGGQFGGLPPRGNQFGGPPPRGGQFGGPPPRGGQFGGPPPRGGQFGGRPPRGRGQFGGPQPNGQGPSNDPVMCTCGQAAKRLTVRKEGPNTGRHFYKCSKDECRFFEWDDDNQAMALPAQQAPPAKQRLCGLCRQPGHNRTRCPRK